jgi:membrane peptidoglycan carboxypeptidase
LRTALEQSLNVPIARLGLAIGPERIIEVARALGVESPLEAVASLSLGVCEVTPLELTHAYAVLAAEGERSALRGFTHLVGADGTELAYREVRRVASVDPGAAFLVTSALTGAVERGTARRLRALGVRGEIAAKTGSTNDYRDAWLVGYTPELAIGVWVGLDEGEPLGASGAGAALPIFADFLRRSGLASSDSHFRRPAEVESVSVDPRTGLRAGWGCPGEPELFLAGTEPVQGCGWSVELPWWKRRRDPQVASGPARAFEHRDTCRVRFVAAQGSVALGRGSSHAYRVEGVAGQGGWLSLVAPFPRRVHGPALRIGAGAFDTTLEIDLPEDAGAILVELELESGKRCTDSTRLPERLSRGARGSLPRATDAKR